MHTFRILLAAAIGFAAVPSADTPVSAAVSSEQAVTFLNQQRAANGIPGDLVNRPDWASGCAKHNVYSEATGDWGHSEDPASPFYTPEGAEAAASSVIAVGDGYGPSGENPWEWAPIHLYIMLNPKRTAAGYDASHGYVCMRMYSAERKEPPEPRLFSYPGPGTVGIYPDEYAAEWPYTPQQLVGIPDGEVTGTNILLFSVGTHDLEAESFSLRGPTGTVAARMVDAGTSNEVGSGGWFTGGGVIVPEQPLAEHTTYSVSVKWRDLAYGEMIEYAPEETEAKTRFLSQEFSFTTGAFSRRFRESRPRRSPALRLRRAKGAGKRIRLRLRAGRVLHGRPARFVVYRHERGCGKAFATATKPCGWRRVGKRRARRLRLRRRQILKIRKPARRQKVTVKVRTRPFEVGGVRFASALAKLTIRR